MYLIHFEYLLKTRILVPLLAKRLPHAHPLRNVATIRTVFNIYTAKVHGVRTVDLAH